MDRTERFYKILNLLEKGRPITLRAMIEETEVSRATIKRDLEYLKTRYYAPIVWDREARGYRYQSDSPDGDRFHLPGLWFSTTEAYALLTISHLLTNMEPGLLADHIRPLQTRLAAILEHGGHSSKEIARRIRIIPMTSRPVPHKHFETLAHATLARQRVHIHHTSRQTGASTERDISPQRIIHYRDNWYIDTFCHLRKKIRSFAVDCIKNATILGKKAKDIPDSSLDEALGSGYGIFGGKKVFYAKLRFTPQHARWVANERWHPLQRSEYTTDGSYMLEFPYADDRELLMDILKHGDGVEVIGPKPLRDKVMQALDKAVKKYHR